MQSVEFTGAQADRPRWRENLPFWSVHVAALVGAIPLAALALRPARGFFAKLQAVPQQNILGRVGVVSSPHVDAAQGYVNVEDDGAGLVLQARSETHRFERGALVRLVEYLPDDNAYRVVAQGEPDGS